METFWKVNDVAAVVQVSVGTIYRYVEKHEIPFTKLKRAVRFRPSEIHQWLENRKAGSCGNQEIIGDMQGGETAETGGNV